MLQITANKLKTNKVNIPEIVYIRTIQSTGVGVKDPSDSTKLLLSIQGIAYLKSEWDKAFTSTGDGTTAPTLSIDGLNNTFKTNMLASDAVTGVSYTYFNQIFKGIMITELGLTDADITIVLPI